MCQLLHSSLSCGLFDPGGRFPVALSRLAADLEDRSVLIQVPEALS